MPPSLIARRRVSGARRDADPLIYSPTGHLVSMSRGTLLAQPFDLTTLSASGPRVRQTDIIGMSGWAERRFSISNDATLVYGRSSTGTLLEWIDRAGRELGVIETRSNELIQNPALSP